MTDLPLAVIIYDMDYNTPVFTASLENQPQIGEGLQDYLPRLARVTSLPDEEYPQRAYDTSYDSPARRETNVLGPEYVKERFGFPGAIRRIIMQADHTYGVLDVRGYIEPTENEREGKYEPPQRYVARTLNNDSEWEDVDIGHGIALVRLDGTRELVPFPYRDRGLPEGSGFLVVDDTGNVTRGPESHMPIPPEAGFQVSIQESRYEHPRYDSRGQRKLDIHVRHIGGAPLQVIERAFSLRTYARVLLHPQLED